MRQKSLKWTLSIILRLKAVLKRHEVVHVWWISIPNVDYTFGNSFYYTLLILLTFAIYVG